MMSEHWGQKSPLMNKIGLKEAILNVKTHSEFWVVQSEDEIEASKNIYCNGPGFDPSIRLHSGIWGAADEAVLHTVRKKIKKLPPKYILK